MNVHKVRLAGLGALLAVGALTGCGAVDAATETGTSSKSTAPLTPRETLIKAVPDDDSGSFRFAIKGGTTPMKGVLDAAKHSYAIDVSQTDPDLGFTLTMKFLVIEKKSWIKISFSGTEGLTGLPKLPKKWMLIDPSKIKDKNGGPLAYDNETDPGQTSAVIQAIVDVEQTRPGHFAGTTDLTKQGEAEIVDAATLKALGAKAEKVPFEAAIDAEGRLVSALVKIPAAGKSKAQKYQVTYSGYGEAPTPAAPAAGESQPATATAYEMLNG